MGKRRTRMRRPEEYVHITLDRYDALRRKEKELEEAKYQLEIEDILYKKIANEKEELKKAIKEFLIDDYNIRTYEIEDSTDPESYRFGFEMKEKLFLLKIGVTLEEMIECIRKAKEEYEAEKAAAQEEEQNA
jgi:Mg/Co/Ni transporter MgtE